MTGARLLVTSLLHLFSYRAAGEAREVWRAGGFTVLLLYCQQAGRPVPTQPARHGQKSNWKSLSGSYIFIVPPAHSDILQEELPDFSPYLDITEWWDVWGRRPGSWCHSSQLGWRLVLMAVYLTLYLTGEERPGMAGLSVVLSEGMFLIWSVWESLRSAPGLLQDFMVAGGVLGGRQGWRGQ